MGHKEKYSRRDFAKVFGLGATGLLAGSYIHKLASYNQPTQELTRISIQDLEANLRVANKNTFRLNGVENDVETVQVKVNKLAFAEALYTIARLDNEDTGISRVNSFLGVSPLKIKFEKSKPLERPLRYGKTGQEEATYAPALYVGGPYITFTNSYMSEYYKAKASQDYVNLALREKTIYEELYHLVQDSRDPKKFLRETASYNTEEFISWLGTIFNVKTNEFDRNANRIENERSDSLENSEVYMKLLRSQQFNTDNHIGSFFSFNKDI